MEINQNMTFKMPLNRDSGNITNIWKVKLWPCFLILPSLSQNKFQWKLLYYRIGWTIHFVFEIAQDACLSFSKLGHNP